MRYKTNNTDMFPCFSSTFPKRFLRIFQYFLLELARNLAEARRGRDSGPVSVSDLFGGMWLLFGFGIVLTRRVLLIEQ